jgi:hypothetical protein
MPDAPTQVLGIPGARVVAFRTAEDAALVSGNPTGAMVRLQLGDYTYDYYHLSQVYPEIYFRCAAIFNYDNKKKADTKPQYLYYEKSSGPKCDFVVPSDFRFIGFAGGTGAGKDDEHLHFKMTGPARTVCKGGVCLEVAGVVDPFPSLLAKMSFSKPLPATLNLGDALEFGIKGEDFSGQPVLSDIAHTGYPSGNQRFLCLTDSAGTAADPSFAFEGDYSLTRWVPAPFVASFGIPVQHQDYSVLGRNSKCHLWSAASQNGGFKLKAKKKGATTLSAHYTDQRVELTPLESDADANAIVEVADPKPRRSYPYFLSISNIPCGNKQGNISVAVVGAGETFNFTHSIGPTAQCKFGLPSLYGGSIKGFVSLEIGATYTATLNWSLDVHPAHITYSHFEIDYGDGGFGSITTVGSPIGSTSGSGSSTFVACAIPKPSGCMPK